MAAELLKKDDDFSKFLTCSDECRFENPPDHSYRWFEKDYFAESTMASYQKHNISSTVGIAIGYKFKSAVVFSRIINLDEYWKILVKSRIYSSKDSEV